jgi:uncharacterized protein (DUF1330 family)
MLYLTVKLYGKNGLKGEFRSYETKALNLFRKHGGEVVVAYEPVRDAADFPDEIQILRIAGKAELERFMNDPERLALSEERSRVIRKTEIYLSDQVVEY